MSAKVFELQQAIKQQSEDLREELAELQRWEDEVKVKGRDKNGLKSDPTLPPIRGTAPPPTQTTKSTPKEDPAVVAKEQGNEYFRRCQYDDAVRMYTKGIEADPTGKTAAILLSNRAMSYLKLQNWASAEEDATNCILLDKTNAKGFYRRALARKARANYAGARSDLETALVLSPGDTETQRELSVVSQHLRSKQSSESHPSSSSQPQKKKSLVIEEVEDDEEVAATEPEPARDKQPQSTSASSSHVEQHALQAVDAPNKEAPPQAKPVVEEKRDVPKKPERDTRRYVDPRIEELPDEDTPKKARQNESRPEPLPTKRTFVPTIQKENLRCPKAFSDFEKCFVEISGRADLLDHYLSLIPNATLKSLFGSSMTPEILVAILESCRRVDPAVAKARLTGLCSVSRLDELVMFFEHAEKDLAESVIKHVECAATATEVAGLRKKFQL